MLNDSDSSKKCRDAHILHPEPSNQTFSDNITRLPSSQLAPESSIDISSEPKNGPGILTAAAYVAVPTWASISLMATLILGGCCANVFTLEAIIKEQPTAGPLITFVQFILCAVFTLPQFFSLSAGPQAFFLSRRAIPLRSWLIYTSFFATVNLLNNWAFAYKISVPLHIILRSGGPVASMLVGYLFNDRRYSRVQILAVTMLTVGVAAAALADAQSKDRAVSTDLRSEIVTETTGTGFIVLALAMVLSAFQGIYADRLYATYGRDHWKEALFYSHTLSLPLFLTSYPQLSSQWSVISSTPSLRSRLPDLATIPLFSLPLSPSSSKVLNMLRRAQKHTPVQTVLDGLPVQVVYLAMNALTQYMCIRGVHLLNAKSSSLTVTIVLNIRKLVSLLLSIRLFGNHLTSGVLAGAVLVFVGGGLYGFEGALLRKKATMKAHSE